MKGPPISDRLPPITPQVLLGGVVVYQTGDLGFHVRAGVNGILQGTLPWTEKLVRQPTTPK